MSGHGNRRTAFEVASFKAMDDANGEFEALVSVFGNVDRGGDRVVRGAFAKSLNRWREKGDPIPVIWNHMWENPEAHIGAVDAGDAVETDDGLLVKGRVDLDNPFAKQVYRLLSERRVKEFSFGYDLKDSERKDGALELREIDLFELGPTLKGMNTETELLAVKALASAVATKVSERPWSDFSAADYTPQQWRNACLIDTGDGETDSKSRYKLPVREPGGAVNRAGCHAAASVLGGGRGGVDASTDQKASAARKLVSLYRSELDEEPPESLVDLAGKTFDPAVKAGARHSKETLAALNRMRDELDQLIAAGQPSDDETPKSTEAEAEGKASDPDADITTQIQLMKERLR